MELDRFLTRMELLDCDGRTSHTLVLEPDGTITVRFRAGHRARIDPATRTVLTPGVTVPVGLLDAACRLAR